MARSMLIHWHMVTTREWVKCSIVTTALLCRCIVTEIKSVPAQNTATLAAPGREVRVQLGDVAVADHFREDETIQAQAWQRKHPSQL